MDKINTALIRNGLLTSDTIVMDFGGGVGRCK
jgi:hypothetical protein